MLAAIRGPGAALNLLPAMSSPPGLPGPDPQQCYNNLYYQQVYQEPQVDNAAVNGQIPNVVVEGYGVSEHLLAGEVYNWESQ